MISINIRVNWSCQCQPVGERSAVTCTRPIEGVGTQWVCEWQHMTNINDDVDWQFQRDHMTSINSGVGMVSLQCGLMGSKTLREDSEARQCQPKCRHKVRNVGRMIQLCTFCACPHQTVTCCESRAQRSSCWRSLNTDTALRPAAVRQGCV
jgi:hypothetical protein